MSVLGRQCGAEARQRCSPKFLPHHDEFFDAHSLALVNILLEPYGQSTTIERENECKDCHRNRGIERYTAQNKVDQGWV